MQMTPSANGSETQTKTRRDDANYKQLMMTSSMRLDCDETTAIDSSAKDKSLATSACCNADTNQGATGDNSNNSCSNSNGGFSTVRSRLAEVGHQLRVVLPTQHTIVASKNVSLTTPTIFTTGNLPPLIAAGPINQTLEASSVASSTATGAASSTSSASSAPSSSSSSSSSSASSLASLASRASLAAVAAAAANAAAANRAATGNIGPGSGNFAPNSAVTNQILNSLVQLNSPETCLFTGLPSCTPASADRLTTSVVNPFFWGVTAFNNQQSKANDQQQQQQQQQQQSPMVTITSCPDETPKTTPATTTATTTTTILPEATMVKAQADQRQRLANLSLQQAQTMNVAILSPFSYWLSPEQEAWLRLGMSPTQNPISAMNQYQNHHHHHHHPQHQQQTQPQHPPAQQQQHLYTNVQKHNSCSLAPQDLTQTYQHQYQQQQQQQQDSSINNNNLSYGAPVANKPIQISAQQPNQQQVEQFSRQEHIIEQPTTANQQPTIVSNNTMYQTRLVGRPAPSNLTCPSQPGNPMILTQQVVNQQQQQQQAGANQYSIGLPLINDQPQAIGVAPVPPPIAHNQHQYQTVSLAPNAGPQPPRIIPVNNQEDRYSTASKKVATSYNPKLKRFAQQAKQQDRDPHHSNGTLPTSINQRANVPSSTTATSTACTPDHSCCSSPIRRTTQDSCSSLIDINASSSSITTMTSIPHQTTNALPTASNGHQPLNNNSESQDPAAKTVTSAKCMSDKDNNQQSITLQSDGVNHHPTNILQSGRLNEATNTTTRKTFGEVAETKSAASKNHKACSSKVTNNNLLSRPNSNKNLLGKNRPMTTANTTTIDANGVEVVKKKSKGGRKKKIVTFDELLARKNRSKERNRVAAKRCRQKRKQFLDELRDRIDNLNDLNSKLMKENSMLKNELELIKQHHNANGGARIQ